MEFSFTFEVSQDISERDITGVVLPIQTTLQDYLSAKEIKYLTTFYISLVCVAPQFEQFFKLRKPTYKIEITKEMQDEKEYNTKYLLTYDLKLDYKTYSHCYTSYFEIWWSRFSEKDNNGY